MSEVERFLEIFGLAARQAGYAARHLQGEISLRTKKGEKSAEAEALTAVDLAAQDIILLLLHSAFPEVAVDAEEKTETVGLFLPSSPGKSVIVVDPIDGTLNYSRGSKEYAVMAAWLERDLYRAALVHFPALQETYWARRGAGCRKDKAGAGGSIRIGPLPQRVLVTPGVSEHHRQALRGLGFEVVVSRCSAVDATAPAAGKAAAALSLGRPSRRRAIGYLVTMEAGGVVRIGERWWKGEDPLSLPDDRQPAVVAESRDTADRIINAVTGKG
jgi:myo-inositol-1(or 4)-monophosphatase